MNKTKDIVLFPIEKLAYYKKNNNLHTPEQIKRLIKLIEFYGFRDPLIVNKKVNEDGFHEVLAGNGRLEAVKEMGWSEVPVQFQEFKSDDEVYGFVTSHNAISAQNWGGGIDLSKVNIDFVDLSPDFDLDMLGIENFVIEPIEKFEGKTDEDEVPEVVHPITRRGDIWLLGKHRLMCGDSTMINDVEKLIADHKPNLMVTDPPYGVKLDQSWRDKAMGEKSMGKGNANIVENDDRADWYDAWVLFPGNIIYVWHASSFTDVVMDSLRRADLR